MVVLWETIRFNLRPNITSITRMRKSARSPKPICKIFANWTAGDCTNRVGAKISMRPVTIAQDWKMTRKRDRRQNIANGRRGMSSRMPFIEVARNQVQLGQGVPSITNTCSTNHDENWMDVVTKNIQKNRIKVITRPATSEIKGCSWWLSSGLLIGDWLTRGIYFDEIENLVGVYLDCFSTYQLWIFLGSDISFAKVERNGNDCY